MTNCRCVDLPIGTKYAHCTACHQTFTTPNNFDRHRRGDTDARQCLDPRDCGFVPAERVGFTAWSAPGRDEDALFATPVTAS